MSEVAGAARWARLEGWLRRGRWLVLVAVLGLVGVLGHRAVGREDSARRGDTRFYQRGAQRFWSGLPLYRFEESARPGAPTPTTAYTYLPPFAASLVWARPVPYRALRGLWLGLACAALGAASLAGRRLAQLPPWPACWLALLALWLGRFAVNDLAHGQVNAFLALLLCAGLREAYGERPLRGGLWLGLALSIKPTAWLILPWLALDRRWRPLGAALAVGAGALLLCWPLYAACGGDYLGQLQEWFRLMPEFASAEAGRPYNASLAAALQRLAAGSDEAAGLRPLLLGLPVEAVRPWARGGAVVCVALGLGWVWRRCARGALGSARAAASVLALSALLSPVTWKAHLIALLAPAAYACADLVRGQAGPARGAGFLLVAALFLLPSQGLGALGAALEAWGGLCAGVLGVFLLCALEPAQVPLPASE